MKNILLLSIILLLIDQSFSTNEVALSKYLQESTSVFARPVKNRSHPVVVEFGFELIHLLSLVEHDQIITTKVWMRMSWKNDYMTWDPKKYGGVNITKLGAETAWTPDLFVIEDISDSISAGPDEFKTPITIQSDGRNKWNIPVKLQTSCEVDVTYFPFDRQSCKLKFTSWTHDQTEIDLELDPKPVVSSSYINSSAWDLVSVKKSRKIENYDCCPNPYVDVTYTINLKRKPKYYVANIIIPCVIQMIIILFTFFLPPDSGERIGVVITVLLVFAVYLEVVSSSLPKTSHSSPTLAHFYIVAMTESALSLIATCFVLVIHFKGTEKGVPPMPEYIRRYFIDIIAKYVWVRINLREYNNDDLLALKTTNDEHDMNEKEDAYMNNTSVGIHMSPEECESPKGDMLSLIQEVRIITQLIHDQNRQDEIEEEWQILGKVFDRLFFLLFLAIFTVSSCVILLPVYIRSLS